MGLTTKTWEEHLANCRVAATECAHCVDKMPAQANATEENHEMSTKAMELQLQAFADKLQTQLANAAQDAENQRASKEPAAISAASGGEETQAQSLLVRRL